MENALDQIRDGGKRALAGALTRIEAEPDGAETMALLDAAYAAPRAHAVGLTGPPGVGKSTLTASLIEHWRSLGRTVGVIAVDPSSKISGGALLGDRTRLRTDPADQGVFVRSMAARDRLGGLADLTVAALVLMRALFDVVLVETVGVGQSETDVSTAVDTVVLCIQPGSGDALQFMKAGIVEIPDIVAVTKIDMGMTAAQAQADLASALDLRDRPPGEWAVAALGVSALKGEGVDDLVGLIDRHFAHLAPALAGRRQTQAGQWLIQFVRERWGREGVKRAGALTLDPGISPFRTLSRLARDLAA
ncbi:MAG TPA: methylmalonyl Co-A mutase-associated GTPase MeaB [Aliidongia sp.]|uniref:ArgK/MeaB family GTPase n=1 Tax=Aliidongia sp. TaxID=1914230 RepID=UPI002DDD4D9E|nr:methylmalonyl Co-A mutase-associated GTPase MeaB [Aliidongia sp.]HEV2675982.1 methylmalonyl Co-A mutase-associated GTPase MeaB [Aliidongia sp.]